MEKGCLHVKDCLNSAVGPIQQPACTLKPSQTRRRQAHTPEIGMYAILEQVACPGLAYLCDFFNKICFFHKAGSILPSLLQESGQLFDWPGAVVCLISGRRCLKTRTHFQESLYLLEEHAFAGDSSMKLIDDPEKLETNEALSAFIRDRLNEVCSCTGGKGSIAEDGLEECSNVQLRDLSSRCSIGFNIPGQAVRVLLLCWAGSQCCLP